MGFHQYLLPMDFLGLPALAREYIPAYSRCIALKSATNSTHSLNTVVSESCFAIVTKFRTDGPASTASINATCRGGIYVRIAKSFRGRVTDELAQKIAEALRRSASKANIALSAETRICRFDPPFKPGFLQYNEIVIPAHI